MGTFSNISITELRPSPISYRNQPIDLQSKSLDWFLYDIDLGRERVNRGIREVF